MKVKYDIDLSLVMDKTILEIKDISWRVMQSGGSNNAGIEQKTGIAALYVTRELKDYPFSSQGLKLTLGQFLTLKKRVAEEFIHIHRLNYMAYRSVQDVYDWMEEKHYVTPNVKRFWKKIESIYSDYQKAHKERIDHDSYVTVQDHVRLASDTIQHLIPPLEISIRDYLIQKRDQMLKVGQKDDITLLSKVQDGIMFCAALRNTFKRFLVDCANKYGVDLFLDYKYADISSIGRNFVWMMEQLGVKFSKDKDGDYVLLGVSVDDSIRVESAWDAIVKIVTNEDIMDEMAKQAVYMNPVVRADYERNIAIDEEKQMNEAVKDLNTKFKVGKL